MVATEGRAVALGGRRWTINLLFWAWSGLAILPGGYLMASHLIQLPAPIGGVTNTALQSQIARLRTPADKGQFFAVHIVLGTCGCSGRVLDHLVERGPREGTAERVMLIDDADMGMPVDAGLRERVLARGIPVETLSPQELERRFSIVSAPMLVVMSPSNQLSYVGGYTDRKQSPNIQDAEILDRLALGQTVEPLPLFGCAVSSRLKETLDPLGLKR